VLSKPTIQQIVAQENQAATLASGQLMFWKLSNKGVKPDGVLDAKVTTMQLAPDSNKLAISTSDNRCLLYDFSKRKKLAELELENNQGHVTAIAWQTDSKTIALGRSTGTIEVLKLNKDNFDDYSSTILQLKTPIDRPVSRLAYSQNGTLLATISEQGMAVLIRFAEEDAANNQDHSAAFDETVFRYTDEQTILTADISADGNRIVSGSNTGRVTIWNSQPNDQPHNQPKADSVRNAAAERELLSLPNLHQSAISVVRFVNGPNSNLIYSAERNSGKNEFISWPSANSTAKLEDTLQQE